MCSIAASAESTTPHREDQRQELLRVVLLGRGARPARAGQGADALVAAQLDARVGQRAQGAGQEVGRDVGVDEQRLRRVADAGALRLGVEDDRLGHREVGARVDVDVAVAGRRVDHRHLGDRLERPLEPLAAARDHQVDQALLGAELGQLLAAAAGHEGQRARRQAVGLDRVARDPGEDGVRVRGGRRAAQHDRVARLEAQRGGVDRHVRARLVDDGDDAERDAHLAHLEPVREPRALDHLADRVGQRDDLADPARHPGDPAAVEREPVHQRVGEPRLAARLEVAGVGLEDLGRARLERVGDREQRAVLGGRVERGQLARGGLGGAAELGDGLGGDGHRARIGHRRARPRAARGTRTRPLRPARSSRGGRPRRSPAASARAPARSSSPSRCAARAPSS